MLKILYFASVRESLGKAEQALELPPDCDTVADLIEHLRQIDSGFAALLAAGNAPLVAVNQTVATLNQPLSQADEVAFFPPMTGG